MSPPLKVGAAGCGRIARLFHLSALAAVPEVEVVALAEPAAEALAQAQLQHPNARACRHYNDWTAGQCPLQLQFRSPRASSGET
jgi:predicted dehydrogenase